MIKASGFGVFDDWLEQFLEPLRSLTTERAVQLGAKARQRVLAHHTYIHRAAQLETILDAVMTPRQVAL